MTLGLRNVDQPSARQQIFSILFVLGSAVLLGCLIVLAMIYTWGPNGTYAMTDILLAPATLEKLAYDERGGSAKESDKLVFDRIDFRTYNAARQRWEVVRVPLAAYERFYSTIAQDRSIREPNEGSSGRFDTSNSARLIIWVRSKGARTADRAFQEMDIPLQGDLYRIEMHGAPTTEWIYFDHPGIGQLARQILIDHQ